MLTAPLRLRKRLRAWHHKSAGGVTSWIWAMVSQTCDIALAHVTITRVMV
jgi:hypothetical protein